MNSFRFLGAGIMAGKNRDSLATLVIQAFIQSEYQGISQRKGGGYRTGTLAKAFIE
jgi:hypothetical protein